MSRKSRRSTLNILLISILVISMFTLPMFLLIPKASAAPVTVLTSKWGPISGLGTSYEGGMVIGDINGDGHEEVVFAGYSLSTPSARHITVLNGATGATLYEWYSTRIGGYCQPQLYDVDGDGVLDMLVPFFSPPGLAFVKYFSSNNSLGAVWSVNTEGTGQVGSVMAKPVAGDIDGDGKLDIFIASQDVSPGNYTDDSGFHSPNGYRGTVCRINATNGAIIAQTFSWRPCSGGLSLADTDNDGVFELYQGDRGEYYGDGNYGAGERSWWAENLTIRWQRFDALTSSQAPALVDVNGDGILDVVTGMYSEMSILNSTNGQWINHLGNNMMLPNGTVVSGQRMSVHYGTTVYDIDADGHLELLTNDGDHDDDNFADIFDLVTGQLKAELYLGNYNSTQPYDEKWAPLVADIYPNGNNPDGSPRMEIITGANTTSASGGQPASLLIFDNNYNLLQNITGQSTQVGYPIVQDIDNDGLLELVTDSSGGTVRAFDTTAPAPGYNQVDCQVHSALDLRLPIMVKKELVQQFINLHLGLQTTGLLLL